MTSAAFRKCAIPLFVAASSLALLVPDTASAQMVVQGPATFQQQYQVALLLPNSVAGSATFLFTLNSLNADGTTGGLFTANVEGNLIQGRYLALDFGSESLWVVQAAGPQVGFVARGWKTSQWLAGEGTVSLAINGQIFRQTFFLIGQGVVPQVQPQTPAPTPLPPSAQPDVGPNAPDARP